MRDDAAIAAAKKSWVDKPLVPNPALHVWTDDEVQALAYASGTLPSETTLADFVHEVHTGEDCREAIVTILSGLVAPVAPTVKVKGAK